MFERLEADIKAALLGGDKDKARALNFIKSTLTTAAKDQSLDLHDDSVMTTLLRKEMKKRQEAADLFTRGGNGESAEKELAEASLISEYLPLQLSDDEISAKLAVIMNRDGLPKEMSSMGRLIGAAKVELGPSADPSTIARLASELVKG